MNEYGINVQGIEGGLGYQQKRTLRERLEDRKAQAEGHLKDVADALKFLDENPNFESFHNLVGKTGF